MAMGPEWSLGVTIPTRQLEITRKFYEDILKCEVVRETPAAITYRSGGSYFDLYPTQSAGTGQHTLGCFNVDNLESAVAELRSRGVQFEHYDMPFLKTDAAGIVQLEGEKAAWFRDPDGNILSVAQRTAI